MFDSGCAFGCSIVVAHHVDCVGMPLTIARLAVGASVDGIAIPFVDTKTPYGAELTFPRDGVAQVSSLPAPDRFHPLQDMFFMAIGPDGSSHVVATRAMSTDKTVVIRDGGSTPVPDFTVEAVQIDASGTLQLVGSSPGSHELRTGPEFIPLPFPHDPIAAFERDTAGVPILLTATDSFGPNPVITVARLDGSTDSFANDVNYWDPWLKIAATPTQALIVAPSSSGGPDVVLHRDADGWSPTIPPVVPLEITSDCPNSCPQQSGECVMKGKGAYPSTMTPVATSDGRFWLAWLEVDLNMPSTFSGGIDGPCFANPHEDLSDLSVSTRRRGGSVKSAA